MTRVALISMMLLAACGGRGQQPGWATPVYMGAQAFMLDNELMQVRVRVRNTLEPDDVTAYAECAAAGYADSERYRFARHIRTDIDEDAGIWSGDAVFTVSDELPPGMEKIDADVVIANCRERGIPVE